MRNDSQGALWNGDFSQGMLYDITDAAMENDPALAECIRNMEYCGKQLLAYFDKVEDQATKRVLCQMVHDMLNAGQLSLACMQNMLVNTIIGIAPENRGLSRGLMEKMKCTLPEEEYNAYNVMISDMPPYDYDEKTNPS